MRVVVVGLGIQGNKRLAIAGPDVIGSVDPDKLAATYRVIEDVPTDAFDAALVCTPDQAKIGLLEYLLAQGKHVLVEKPLLANDSAQLERLETIAARSGAMCYTAYNHRFEPHLASLKALIAAGTLGDIYLARFLYANGTARDVRNSSWRDQGAGVLPDLGSHLLDMAVFLFGDEIGPFEPWSFNCLENRSFDHVLFGSKGSPVLEMEAMLLSWRNSFRLDVYGEHGTAHIDGLCKWGPSSLTVRGRVLPSGKPNQRSETLEQPDPTWAIEYEHFKQLCATGSTGLRTDVWISSTLNHLADQAGVSRWA